MQGIHEYQLFSKQFLMLLIWSKIQIQIKFFLSIRCRYKAGKGSLKKTMTLDIVLAVGIETS